MILGVSIIEDVKRFLTLVTIITSSLLFYRLGSFPFENWDEAWYAEMAKEMMQRGSFIVTYWNYGAYFDKPPLFIWLGIISIVVFLTYRTYVTTIAPTLHPSPIRDEVESSKVIKKLTKPTEIIVRMDNLYPATIYYSDRQVAIVPFIGEYELLRGIQFQRYHWLVGQIDDGESFLKNYLLVVLR